MVSTYGGGFIGFAPALRRLLHEIATAKHVAFVKYLTDIVAAMEIQGPYKV